MYDRPKMSQAMYQSLKRHIVRQRKKDADMKMLDATNQRLRAEREELRRQTLQSLRKTKDEVERLQGRLEKLRKEKSKLFSRFKEVFAEESVQKERQKEVQSHLPHLQQQFQQQQQQTSLYLQDMRHSQPPPASSSTRLGKRAARSPSPVAGVRQAKAAANTAVFSQQHSSALKSATTGHLQHPLSASYRGSITTGQSAQQMQFQMQQQPQQRHYGAPAYPPGYGGDGFKHPF
ncbi:hypothetical protein BOX15_Mlig010138g1 [Macrostomum lignano]|nr:hypothetical protein BOX15_Mlig010138g1 [Macrostomum lignano]